MLVEVLLLLVLVDDVEVDVVLVLVDDELVELVLELVELVLVEVSCAYLHCELRYEYNLPVETSKYVLPS